MYAFALTAVGAVVVGAAVEFFVVDGEMKKYMSAAVSLIIIVILITPVVGIFGSGITLDGAAGTEEQSIVLDIDCLDAIAQERANNLVSLVDSTFFDLRYKAKVVSFELGEEVLIKKITISTLDDVIKLDGLNIVDVDDIVEVVKNIGKSSIESIVVDGKYV